MLKPTKIHQIIVVVTGTVAIALMACAPAERPENPQLQEPARFQQQSPAGYDQQRPAGDGQQIPIDQRNINQQQGTENRSNNINRDQQLRQGTTQPGGMQFQSIEGSEEEALEQENTPTGEEHSTGRVD